MHEILMGLYPEATVELDHRSAYELLVATILAAQANDKTINQITPALFAKYPDAAALAAADQLELEPLIYKSGFFRAKAGYLLKMARALVESHDGEVPTTMAELVLLPGVARKTANVVLGCALGKNEGIVVDTHVIRLSQRLGLTFQTEPADIEPELMAIVPQDHWAKFAHGLIWHGRRVCDAKAPDCEHCALAPLCPSAGVAIVEARSRAIEATKRGALTRAANAAQAPAKKPPAKKKPAKKKPAKK
ncbi:MAG: endonuclease III, partial [Proteobacteria bacterium]|nr:endonuclease III [Pseudomonadota bacterium]